MKVLHTADWHLGKRFGQMELTDEHTCFMAWLIDTINAEGISLLIIAGDIFDSGNPPHTALKQYYDFLWKVKGTCCRHVIITGGNHDSVPTLNAPKDLLKHLDIYVVGGVPDDVTDEIIPISNADGTLAVVVCAVPFLRDKDLKLSVSGENNLERELRIKAGIAAHYHQLVPFIQQYKQQHIPVIATGHLFAAGALTSAGEKGIHAGNLGQIGSSEFPAEYDYIALGHLHRPQLVNKQNHMRYSGSPVPLDFSEHNHSKMVLMLNFEQGALAAVTELEVPCFRRLYRIKGPEEVVKEQLARLPDGGNKYPAWVDVEVETDIYLPYIEEQLDLIKGPHIGQLFVKQVRLTKVRLQDTAAEATSLTGLDPKEIFLKRCAEAFPGQDTAVLVSTFEEALEKMRQAETEPVAPQARLFA